jgi:hypothetical protein
MNGHLPFALIAAFLGVTGSGAYENETTQKRKKLSLRTPVLQIIER